MRDLPAGYGELFDQRGDRYDDAMARWPAARAEELAFACRLAAVGPGERVLDVPSGGGYLAQHLPAAAHVLSVEPSAVFAERSRRQGHDVVRCSLRAEAVADRSIDVLVSVAGVHHDADLVGLLAAWRRVLAPGGRIVVADVARGSAVAEFLDGFVGRHTAQGHVGTYLGDDLAQLAHDAGYRDIEVIDGAYRWWADDLDDLAAFCTELFGLEGVTTAEVGQALVDGPGVEVADDGRAGLRWGLRALVARSADV